MRLEPTKLILMGTRVTYQATADAGSIGDKKKITIGKSDEMKIGKK